MKKKKKWIKWVVILVIVAAVVGWFMMVSRKTQDVAYTNVQATLGSIETYYNFDGLVKAKRVQTITAAQSDKVRTVYVTPQGAVFNQQMAKEFAKEEDLIFLCGHYEGIDERVLEETVTDYVSIGDYVLTGGETAAMVLIDCVSRLVPGVLGSAESAGDESFSNDGLLEYPQYTRPRVFEDMEVPEVLLNGDHKKISQWRREQALLATARMRPDLLAAASITPAERRWLSEQLSASNGQV